MALAAATPFASFDITDGSQIRDISPVLADAIYYDLHLLGAMNVDFGSPVYDTTHYWNEDALNSDTVTTSIAWISDSTAVSVTAGQGTRVHVGDILVNQTTAGATDVRQVTAVSGDGLTVTAGFNGTTKQTSGAGDTYGIIRVEQEGSDIGSDKSVAPLVKSNFTQIFAGAYDILVSGSQLARKMATNQMNDFVARQLANRAIEMKIGMSRAFLYGEPPASSTGGSDTVYRSLRGIRSWIQNNSGVTNTSAQALSYSVLNSVNKSVVDKGVFPDLLVCGTDLVGSISGFDSTVRRLLESDTKVGYTVQQITLNQGNDVRVVVDSRVSAGDAFLLSSERICALPLNGRGMFVIAAVDFADARKRRCLAEWTLEVRNPSAHAYISAKT